MLLVLALLATVPFAPVTRDRVDEAEHNTVYTEDGTTTRYACPQWIFRDEEIVAWKWASNSTVSYHPPLIVVSDGKLRAIRPGRIYATASNYDPEEKDRERLPAERRRGLSK